MDEGNGLHFMRARYYRADIKRFMSLDALTGSINAPQSLNRYAYVMGNPVNLTDPSGNCPFCIVALLWAVQAVEYAPVIIESAAIGIAAYNGINADIASSSPIARGAKTAITATKAVTPSIKKSINTISNDVKTIKQTAMKTSERLNKLHDEYVALSKAHGIKSPHGNSDMTFNKSQLYHLVDNTTNIIKKIGETTRGYSRYTLKYLESKGVHMDFISQLLPKGYIKIEESTQLKLHDLKQKILEDLPLNDPTIKRVPDFNKAFH
jgi:RHS repeat-associated protein